MRNRHGETPKELATAIVLTELVAYARELPFSHRDEYAPNFEKQTRVQIARIHNRLLRDSTLDGMGIDILDINT